MSIAWEITIVACSQFLLVLFKNLNVRTIIKHHVIKSMLLTLAIQSCWLVSSAMGIKGLLDGNYLIVATYLLAGVFGSFFNFKINV